MDGVPERSCESKIVADEEPKAAWQNRILFILYFEFIIGFIDFDGPHISQVV